MAQTSFFAPYADLQSLQKGEVDIAHEKAVTRMDLAQAEKLETGIAADKFAAQRARQRAAANAGEPAKTPTLESLAQDMLMSSQDYVMGGDITKGNQMAQQATAILQHAAAARKTAADERRLTSQRIMQDLKSLYDATGYIKSPMQWQDFLQQALTKDPELANDPTFQQVAKLPWSQGLMDELGKRALTAYQRQVLDDRDRAATDQEERDAGLKAHRTFLEGIRERETQLKEQREQRLRKNGGKGESTRLPPEIRKQSLAVLKQQFPDLKDENDQAAMSHVVAQRAVELMAQNKGMDESSAVYRAVQEEGKNIEQKITGGFKVFGKQVGGKTSTAYSGPGSKPATALPMKGTSLDAYVPGRWYKTPKGPAYFNGKTFETDPKKVEDSGSDRGDSGDDQELE